MNFENKLKHLDFIQAVIARLSGNSFLLKGWSVTLVAALFTLAAKDANRKYVVVAYLPVLIFWTLDAYFLAEERRFRTLYDEVRVKTNEQIDFSMEPRTMAQSTTWADCFTSKTVGLFYASLIGIMLLIMYLIS
jgi:uncharacterized membrane protein